MKEIKLSVSLDDNELFDSEVINALKGQARQIARETLDQEMTKEIGRIVDTRVKELINNPVWNSVNDKIVANLVNKISPNVDYSAVNKMVKEKADNAVLLYFSNEEALQRHVRDSVTKGISQLVQGVLEK